MRRRQHLLYSNITQLFSEVLAENRIAISQQAAWELVKRVGFRQTESSESGCRCERDQSGCIRHGAHREALAEKDYLCQAQARGGRLPRLTLMT